MEAFIEIFGSGKDLTVLQMSCRGITVFIITLLLIRISGRRSFGLRTPLDNIIVILLGAILSRAVVGVSPFLPVVVTCLLIVLLHRFLGRLLLSSERFSNFIEGEKIVLFQHGAFIEENMKRALVNPKDIMLGIRKSASTETLDKIDKIYIEPTGEITVIKKEAGPGNSA